MEENTKKYWDKIREFNLSRTPFWISSLIQLFLTIIPFIVIWILLGADFKDQTFNHYNDLMSPHQAGFLVLIMFGYLFYALIGNTLIWLLKWQKADSFTYTFGLSFVFISIVLNGIWISDWEFNETVVKLLIRFVITLAIGLFGVFIGVIVTTFARNFDYKYEEENYETLLAYRQGQKFADKKEVRLKKALKEEKDRLELEKEKKKIDQNLIKKYDEHRLQQKQKLDAKENKKRKKSSTKK